MLTITRKPGERIMIGDDVVIEVVEVTGSTVRIGITAPRDRLIYREELWERVKRENEEAARSEPGRIDDLAKGEGAGQP